MPVDPEVMAAAKRVIGFKGPALTELVTRKDIRRFAIAIGDNNPLYHDPAYARQLGYPDVIAPPMYHMAHAFPDNDLDGLDDAGVAGSLTVKYEVPSPGFPSSVAGGRKAEFLLPVVAGDSITMQEWVADVYEKEGRDGPMIFVISETRFTNQRGELVATDRSIQIRMR